MRRKIPSELLPGMHPHMIAGNPSMSCAYFPKGQAKTKNQNPRDTRICSGGLETKPFAGLGVYTSGNHINSFDLIGTIEDENINALAEEVVNNHDFFAIKDRDLKQTLVVSWVDDSACDRIFGVKNDL